MGVINLDWVDQARHRPVPARIYYPQDGAGPFPVIIFSHGLGGSREGYEYLDRFWASPGYVSVHIQHSGSDPAVWQGSNRPFRDMQRAAGQSVSNCGWSRHFVTARRLVRATGCAQGLRFAFVVHVVSRWYSRC